MRRFNLRYLACVLILISLVSVLPAAAAEAGRIAYVSRPQACEEISVMNADGTGHVQLTFDNYYDERPAWSPDGSRIAFGHSYWSTPGMNGMEIYVMNADGTGRTRLTINDVYDSLPSWSPDGSRIAFTSERDGNSEIYVMNADGSRQTRLTRSAGADCDPAWSPDGSRIAFASARNGNKEIYVMKADGNRLVRLTTNAYDDSSPAWSPDGSRIAFTSYRPPFTEIYAMNADGTGEICLTTQSGSLACAMPAWRGAADGGATAPVVSGVTVPAAPVAVRGRVSATATFTDTGSAKKHAATWTWGDGTTSTGTVAAGSVAGTHAYSSAGVYRVTVTVTDGGGRSGTAAAPSFVVVYDPKGGFVTGGGRIASPAGAYLADSAVTCPAAFGFTSAYSTASSKKGSSTTVQLGTAKFLFGLGDLTFQSTSYESLAVGGSKATFRGTGTINGKGAYGFQLSVIDGQQRGGDGTDRFRIRIWDQATGGTVYDNQAGPSDAADPAMAISAGAITIAKP